MDMDSDSLENDDAPGLRPEEQPVAHFDATGPRPEDQPKARFGLQHPPLLAWFSRDLYRDVGQRWNGVGYGYLFLLLTITWLIILVSAHLSLGQFIESQLPPMLEQVPSVTITDGEVITDVEQPYTITNENGEVIFTIDTRENSELEWFKNTSPGALLTSDMLHIRKSAHELRRIELSDVESFAIDQDIVSGWASSVHRWWLMVAIPCCLIGSIVFRCLQNLFYAALGLGLASLRGQKLSFDCSMRLAAIAVTPVILLDTLMSLASIQSPPFFLWPLAGIGISLSYLAFGITSCQRPVIDEAQGSVFD